MSLVFSDTTNRQGLIQGCEDECGLGATGITGNTALLKQFTRWLNIWHKKGMAYAIMSFGGVDPDDPNYQTLPSGTFTGTTNRDYYFDSAYKMLKIKRVEPSYDGTTFVVATTFDNLQRQDISVKDSSVDSQFTESSPYFDPLANGFRLYPKFTQAQVDAGAKVYVEWLRELIDFTWQNNDTYTSGLESQFDEYLIKGASYEYAKLYKPELASRLTIDLFGNNGNIRGLVKDLERWYQSKQLGRRRMSALDSNCK